MRFLFLLRLSESSSGQKLLDCDIYKNHIIAISMLFEENLSFVHAEFFDFSKTMKEFFSMVSLGQSRD